jgi:3-methyladenine DNA glycosylase AlkD
MTINFLNEWLMHNANPTRAAFQASLIPDLSRPILGVSLPLLNQKAKELVDCVDEIATDSCEHVLLKAYAVGHIKDVNRQLEYIPKILALTDNWLICDSFCGCLHSAKKYRDAFWNSALHYAASSQPYEQRFAYVMMLKYFCDSEHIAAVLKVLTQALPTVWDCQQAIAWALCESFIKFPKQTEPELQKITPELYRLARRKILDSKRVDDQTKQRLRNENRVLLDQ